MVRKKTYWRVFTIAAVAKYGSTFDDGLRSSRYPFQVLLTFSGILIEAPRSLTPYENLVISWVSCFQVSRWSLYSP